MRALRSCNLQMGLSLNKTTYYSPYILNHLGPAESTRQCNFTDAMMREAAMPKRFSPSKVKEHECEPTPASLKVSVTKFML